MEQIMSGEKTEMDASTNDQHVTALDSGSEDSSIIQVKREVQVDQRMSSARVKDLLKECTRRQAGITYCTLGGSETCLFYQVRFNPNNFRRHIRNLHTEEAKRRGFFEPTVHSARKRITQPKMAKEVNRRRRLCDMVNEYVRHEAGVVYCQIDQNSHCKFEQKLFNPSNFSRHFRLKHPIEAEERGFVKRRLQINTVRRERKVCEMVEACVRHEGGLSYCEIDVSSQCSFVQKNFNPTNFKQHFLAKHPDAAERKGLVKRNLGVNPKLKRVTDAHKLKLAEKVPDFILYRKSSSGRTRYLCNIQPASGCSYYEPLLHIGNRYRLVNHFIRKHPDAALASGFEEAVQSTETDLAEVSAATTHESDLKQQASSSRGKRILVRNLVDKFVLKEGVTARCNIRPECGCTYTQKMYVPCNFVRHFYTKHPSAFVEHGFSVRESMLGKIDNNEEIEIDGLQETSGEGFVTKEKVDEAMAVDDSLPIPTIKHEIDPLAEVEQGGDAASGTIDLEDEDSYVENESALRIGKSITEMVKECVHVEQHVTYCQINSKSACTYSQQNFIATNFARHFRKMHPEEAAERGFLELTANKQNGPSKRRRSNYQSVKPTHRDMIFRYTEVTDEGPVLCRIVRNCPYVQKKFKASNFERHFHNKHPKEAAEKGFKKGSWILESSRYEPLGPLENQTFQEMMFESIMNADSEDLNDGAGPSGMPNSFQSEANPSDEPFVAYENPSDPEVKDNRNVEQQLTTPHEDPSTYCRLCFSVTLSLQPIFASHGEVRTMAEQIATCAGINLSAETEPSASVCCECVQKLDDIQRFRLQCHTLDEVVRGKLVTQEDPLGEECVEGPCEIQIKDELPVDMDEDGDQTRPDVPVDPSDDQSHSERQSSLEDPVDHGEDASRVGNHTCRDCGETFKSTYSMMRHHKEKHSTTATPLVFIKKKFKCTDCDSILPNRSELSTHRQRYHNPDAPPKQKIHCTMPSCTQFFMSRVLLRRHLKTFHGLTDPDQLELMSVLKDS